MKVYFDIITNHTADVHRLRRRHDATAYRTTKEDVPVHRTPRARPSTTATTPTATRFPAVDPTSFPYTPIFATAADATVKVAGLAQRPDDVPQPRRLDLLR